MPKKFLDDLNEEQRLAVTTTEGYVRVLAGAGTGKTKSLTYRYAYLIALLGLSPKSVLCVTFTNKAAEEMKARIMKLCGQLTSPFVCTFHGFCCDFLRDEIDNLGYPTNFSVLDVSDVKEMLRPIYRDLGINGKEFSLQDGWDYIDYIESSRLTYVEEMLTEDTEHLRQKIASAASYKEAMFYSFLYSKRAAAALDFDDLIAFTLQILKTVPDVRARWQKRLEYIMIDEFQDIDKLQYELVEILSAVNKNLFIVGDPDQTIYSFRGADVKLFTQFPVTHEQTRCIALKKNYRSQPFILDCAYTLISRNPDTGRVRLEAVRRDIRTDDVAVVLTPLERDQELSAAAMLRAMENQGRLTQVIDPKFSIAEDAVSTLKPVLAFTADAALEAQYVVSEIMELRKLKPHADCAILYRAHHVSQAFERELIRCTLPYRVLGDISFFERREIKDVMAYLRVCLNPDDDTALRRIINVPRRGFGQKRLERVEKFAKEQDCSLFSALCTLKDNQEISFNSGIRDFIEGVIALHGVVAHNLGPIMALEKVINTFGYEESLKNGGEKERVASLGALRQMADTFEKNQGERTGVADFIREMALFYTETNTDTRGTVKLMTVHNAKGLEFDYVFLVGLNEGTFPSIKSSTYSDLEEERRLMYVAMTRAKKQLFMTVSQGFSRNSAARGPSRFLSDLRQDEICVVGKSPELFRIHEGVELSVHRFALGDRVFHEVFGPGVIEQVDEAEGEYSVRFDSLPQIRTLSFKAPLEKI